MRAIKINALKREITEIEIDGSLEDFYAAADCKMIESAGRVYNGDIIYVDEEGMMNEVGYGFMMASGFSRGCPFLGNGVVTRVGKNGESISAVSKLDWIKDQIVFWD